MQRPAIIGAVASVGLAYVFMWPPGETTPLTNMVGLSALIFVVLAFLSAVAWMCWRYTWAFWAAFAVVCWGIMSFHDARHTNCGDDSAWRGPCQHATTLR